MAINFNGYSGRNDVLLQAKKIPEAMTHSYTTTDGYIVL
jgi:hypothetical protein